MTKGYRVTVSKAGAPDRVWKTGGDDADYDAIHAAAGAVLAGAESVEISDMEAVDE